MGEADFARLIEPVAIFFWGDPNPKLTTAAEARWGARGSKSVDREKGVWYDHEAGIGGGTLDLVSRETGCTGHSAVEWLEEHGFANGAAPRPLRRPEPDAKPPPNRRIVAHYNYTDEAGALLFQVVRFEPKYFVQRRADPGEPGVWIWGLQAGTYTRRRRGKDWYLRKKGGESFGEDREFPASPEAAPYHLTDLQEALAAERTVFIAEGEKAVDALRAAGLSATCSPGGANKWPAGFGARWFAGAHVVILPDNDEPGRKHAEMVAADLAGSAADVRLLDLPGLPERGDVADWLQAGGDAATLYALVDKLGEAPAVPGPTGLQKGPTPFAYPATIPRRRFVLGRHYIRKNLSATIAQGGIGKSSLVIVEALAIVTGRSLLGVEPGERANVWYWNGEDPREELDRRIVAATRHYEIPHDEVEGRLFVDSGKDMEIVVAKQAKNRPAEIMHETIDLIVEHIRIREIGVAIFEPLILTHGVDENDNNAAAIVAKIFTTVASVTGCAIEVCHHSRKTGGNAVTAEDARGASALVWAARSVRTLNNMTAEEAKNINVKNRYAYFRVDNGKANLTARSENADWYKFESVALGNGDPEDPHDVGDKVGVVTAYDFPDLMQNVTVAHLRAAQAAVAKGGPWRKDVRAGASWVGVPIAAAMGLDLNDEAHKATVKEALRRWLLNRMFVEVEGRTKDHKPCVLIEVGTLAT